MSVIRPVLRQLAVAALRANTWAQERVTDSDNTPLLDALRGELPKPYLTVFTDEDIRTELEGMDFGGSKRAVSLVIEFGVAQTVIIREGEPGQIQIPQTSEAMEILLDTLETQVVNALFQHVGSPWCDLIKRIVLTVERVASRRGGQATEGTRWAARSMTFVCDTISDPTPGVPLPDNHPINDFILLAKTNPLPDLGLASAAVIIESVYNSTDPAAYPWQQVEVMLGITSKAVDGIGLGHPIKQPAPYLGQSQPVLREVLLDPVVVPINSIGESEEPGPHYNYKIPPAPFEDTPIAGELGKTLEPVKTESEGG